MSEHHVSLDQLSKVKDGSGHSIFGASSSPMYLNCSGSLIPNILTKDDAGYDAAWGTVAHSVTEIWLKEGSRPTRLLDDMCYVGTEGSGHLISIDEEMLYNAEQCVDWCEWEPGEHVIELHVDFSHLTPIPNQGGTLDFAALQPGIARTTDHKFGASPENKVFAEDNPQLMLYSIGLWRAPQFQHYNFKEFVIRVLQPRLDHFDEWHTTAKRLAEFEDYARERMRAAWQFDAPRTPGTKQCRFCKVKGSCVANAQMQEDLMSAIFGDNTQTVEQMQSFVQRMDDKQKPFVLHFKNVAELNIEQMSRLLQYRKLSEQWWSALAQALLDRASDGQVPPGMKLVDGGRARRFFTSESAARDRLIGYGLPRDKLIREQLVSPAQAEKLLRNTGIRGDALKQALQGYITKPPGKAILVPESDPRPSVVDVTDLIFKDVVESSETEEDY